MSNNDEDEFSGDNDDIADCDSKIRKPKPLKMKEMSGGITPLLGLSELSINCDLEPKSPSAKSLGEIPGSLHARRAKRQLQKQLTISTNARNSEGESENSSSAASSDSQSNDIGLLSPLNCNNNIILPSNIEDCKSPSNFGNGDSPVEILPYLFLGCHKDAKNKDTLKANKITYVLNVTPNLPNVFEDDKDFHYKKIAISDHWSQNLSQFFPEAIAFIGK